MIVIIWIGLIRQWMNMFHHKYPTLYTHNISYFRWVWIKLKPITSSRLLLTIISRNYDVKKIMTFIVAQKKSTSTKFAPTTNELFSLQISWTIFQVFLLDCMMLNVVSKRDRLCSMRTRSTSLRRKAFPRDTDDNSTLCTKHTEQHIAISFLVAIQYIYVLYIYVHVCIHLLTHPRCGDIREPKRASKSTRAPAPPRRAGGIIKMKYICIFVCVWGCAACRKNIRMHARNNIHACICVAVELTSSQNLLHFLWRPCIIFLYETPSDRIHSFVQPSIRAHSTSWPECAHYRHLPAHRSPSPPP